MKIIALNDHFPLAIENHKSRACMVVYYKGVENVCRIESFAALQQFLRLGEGRLFKGRLQLAWFAVGINVEIKGKITGTIAASDFMKCLEDAQQANWIDSR